MVCARRSVIIAQWLEHPIVGMTYYCSAEFCNGYLLAGDYKLSRSFFAALKFIFRVDIWRFVGISCRILSVQPSVISYKECLKTFSLDFSSSIPIWQKQNKTNPGFSTKGTRKFIAIYFGSGDSGTL